MKCKQFAREVASKKQQLHNVSKLSWLYIQLEKYMHVAINGIIIKLLAYKYKCWYSFTPGYVHAFHIYHYRKLDTM